MKVNMAELTDNEILTSPVRTFIDKMVEENFDVVAHCGLKLREKTVDTIALWKLIKCDDNKYRIVYLLLGYNIVNGGLTEEAVINSPRILEMHEILQPDDVDIVKFYIDNACNKKCNKEE